MRSLTPSFHKKYFRDGKVPVKFLLDWYDAHLREGSQAKICSALGVSTEFYQSVQKGKYPDLALAKEMAEGRRGSGTLSDYIFKQLSPEAQALWEKIKFWDEEGANTYTQIERILKGQTKKLRQELFVHALVNSSFDPSEAMRIVGISRQTYELWRAHDLDFRQLIEEIQWHKRNFFEKALHNLVEERHPAAVLFVNRTINADRGYGEKMKVEHEVTHGVRLEELDLDVETQRKILDAIRRKGELKDAKQGRIMDVESSTDRQLLPVPIDRD